MWLEKLNFAGKRAIVTGGASGIGAAAAATLVELAAEVHVLDVQESHAAGVAYHHVDLGDEASIDRAIVDVRGPIDVLFSCAGMPRPFPREM